jgi:branched-chain amino acid transport system substrate-binding protein
MEASGGGVLGSSVHRYPQNSPAQRRRLSLFALLPLVGAIMAGCTSNSPATSLGGIPPGPITLGAIYSLSGTYAAVGDSQEKTEKILIQQLNENGGIAGHKVVLDVKNDQSDPAIAASAAEQLVADRVAAVVYDGTTATDVESRPILAKAHIPIVMVDPSDQWNSGKLDPYFFSTYPLNKDTMTVVARFMQKQMGVRRLGIIHDTTPFADDLLADLTPALSAEGLSVVKDVAYDPTAVDVTTQVTQLKDAGADGIIVLAEGGIGTVYNDIKALGWHVSLVAPPITYLIGFSSLGYLAASAYTYCTVALKPGDTLPAHLSEVTQTVAAQAGTGAVLGGNLLTEADPLYILKYAIESTRGLNPDQIVKAIEGIHDRSFIAAPYAYTFGPSQHDGYPQSEIHMCTLSKVGALETPVLVPNSA